MLLNCGAGEDSLESPGLQEDQTNQLLGNQPWIFIGRGAAEVKAPVPWPPDGKSWLTEKDPDAGKDWGREEKGAAEDEMIRWHHRLDGCEFGQTQGQWRTEEPGVPQCVGLHRISPELIVSEQQQCKPENYSYLEHV